MGKKYRGCIQAGVALSKIAEALEGGGDDPRWRKVRREFKAVYGYLPDLDEPVDGWYPAEGALWSVDIEGQLLLKFEDVVYVIDDISSTPKKLVEQ